jgi:phage terminase large subunit
MDKVIAVKKWKGSVEDGVMHLRSYKEIVVHPQCQGVLKESRLYSYKVDKEGNITTDIVDDHNHYIDAIRYALTPYIKRKKGKRARIPRSQQ